jgi:hypothetical protein
MTSASEPMPQRAIGAPLCGVKGTADGVAQARWKRIEVLLYGIDAVSSGPEPSHHQGCPSDFEHE